MSSKSFGNEKNTYSIVFLNFLGISVGLYRVADNLDNLEFT